MNELKQHLIDLKNSLSPDRNILDRNISALSSFVERYYSPNNPYSERVKHYTQVITFFKIQKRDSNPLYGFTTESIMSDMNDLIDNVIAEIDNLGLPDKNIKIDKSININNVLSQNQTLNISLFIEAIKDELSGKQIKELKDIESSESDPIKKKEKIITKIKSFGSDILSNIVANILTNPTIWSNL